MARISWSELAESRGEALLRAGKPLEAEGAFVRDRAMGRALSTALLLADSEDEPRARLVHLGRARLYAAEGTDDAGAREVALRYHRARQSLLESAAPGRTQRSELSEIGRSLEALNALEDAVRAYTAAGDREAVARVLASSGDIEGLEDALRDTQTTERTSRSLTAARAEVGHLISTGQRRAARARLDLALHDHADAELERIRDRLDDRRARARGTVVEEHGAAPWTWIFGDEVVVGRGDGAGIVVQSPLVSRRHLVLRRGHDGRPSIAVEGRGTLLGGALVAGDLSLNGYLELSLGPARCAFEPLPDGGVVVTAGGQRFRLALGLLSVGPFVVRPDGDGLRLEAAPAIPYLDGVTACPEGVDLERGDRFAEARGGPIVLRVLE